MDYSYGREYSREGAAGLPRKMFQKEIQGVFIQKAVWQGWRGCTELQKDGSPAGNLLKV